MAAKAYRWQEFRLLQLEDIGSTKGGLVDG